MGTQAHARCSGGLGGAAALVPVPEPSPCCVRLCSRAPPLPLRGLSSASCRCLRSCMCDHFSSPMRYMRCLGLDGRYDALKHLCGRIWVYLELSRRKTVPCFLGSCTLFCTGTVNETFLVLLGTKFALLSHQKHLCLTLPCSSWSSPFLNSTGNPVNRRLLVMTSLKLLLQRFQCGAAAGGSRHVVNRA